MYILFIYKFLDYIIIIVAKLLSQNVRIGESVREKPAEYFLSGKIDSATFQLSKISKKLNNNLDKCQI